MNRQFFGMLAVILTTASVQTSYGQARAYPPAGPYAGQLAYPAQPAVYMNFNPAMSGVYPATMGAAVPGAVQRAGCPTCGPTSVQGVTAGAGNITYPGDAVYQGAGCDAGCDGGCDTPGGCASGGKLFRCGKLFGGCGLFKGGCKGGCAGGACGGGGCSEGCGGSHGFSRYHGLCGKLHGASDGGGRCLPRWYDVQAEWLFWKRQYDSSLSLSSQSILGPDALNANQLDLSEESGYRLTGAYLLGVATSLEVSYFGGFNWVSGVNAVSPNRELFSVFSDFGVNPINGFPETDFGYQHEIALSSEMNSGEINVRHRWVTDSCKFHGSILVGARYFRLQEDFLYNTFTDLGAMNYRVKTDNDLVGSQVGGDLYLAVTPRLKIGAEVEGGLFGTSSSQRTNMNSTNSQPLREYDKDNDIAFLGEAGVSVLFRATSQLTLRIGYQVLYVDGVATAVDNFNTASPFTARESFLDNDGDVFYHGSTLGFEWTY